MNDCFTNSGLPYLLQFFKPSSLEDTLSLCEAYILCNEPDSAISLLSQAQMDVQTARKRCVSPAAAQVCNELIALLEEKKEAIRLLKKKKLEKCSKIMNFMEIPPKMSTNTIEIPLPDTPPRAPKPTIATTTTANENNAMNQLGGARP